MNIPGALGIDVGGTKIDAIALSWGGEPVAATRIPTRAESAEELHDSIREAIDKVLADSGELEPIGIGVGIPGLVDPGRGEVAMACNLNIGEDPFPVASLLNDDYGLPVVIDNDLNYAALGTYQHLVQSEPIMHLVYLGLGTGLAAGLVLNGQLYRGRGGVAGEIGHIPVDPAGARCQCGEAGCMETLVSGVAFDRIWPTAEGSSSARELFAAARAGNPEAVSLVEAFGFHLAQLVRMAVLAYDPDRVVLGGGLIESGQALFVGLNRGIERLGRGSQLVRTLALAERVVAAPSGPIGALGAAAAVFAAGGAGVP